jgi:hypothetical protein
MSVQEPAIPDFLRAFMPPLERLSCFGLFSASLGNDAFGPLGERLEVGQYVYFSYLK